MSRAKMLRVGEPLYFFYSGGMSIRFWERIDALKKNHDELYGIGVVLQNLEQYVVDRLLKVEREEGIEV